MPYYCGIDFGTSNSVVAVLSTEAKPIVAIREPSLMFFAEDPDTTSERYCGREALAKYIEAGMAGRFFQSIKSILPDPGFTHTIINGKRFSPEDLVAVMLRFLRESAQEATGVEVNCAVVGRPARFSDKIENDVLAQDRLGRAALQAGFDSVEFEFEPVAGAHAYVSRAPDAADQLVFVADHGGGTSDFTIFRLGVDRDGLAEAREILATNGLRAGGDDFDAAIMWNRIVEKFGYGATYESFGRYLPIPVHIFRIISRWDQIHFLKTLKYREELKYYHRSADDPLAVRRLMMLVEEDLGYFIASAVERAKIELSDQQSGHVHYEHGKLRIDEEVGRAEFDRYIEEYISAIRTKVEETLSDASIESKAISRVFVTGGSSRVVAVKQVLAEVFGEESQVEDHDQFESVARGLALTARARGISATCSS